MGQDKTDQDGRDAHYHLMSRTNDRRFLFEKEAVKTDLVAALRRAAEFCGIGLTAIEGNTLTQS